MAHEDTWDTWGCYIVSKVSNCVSNYRDLQVFRSGQVRNLNYRIDYGPKKDYVTPKKPEEMEL